MAASVTHAVVGAVIGLALVWAAVFLLGWQWGLALASLMVYEGWTLVNASKYDTISDIVREFSRKQLLTPWGFGFVFGIGVATGYLHNPYVIAGLAILQGHWFFTLNEKREEAIKQEAKEEIKEERREVKAEIAAEVPTQRQVRG